MSLKKIIREEMDNSLQWIMDIKSYPTLQQLFDKGEIKEGDVLVLRGEVQSDEEEGKVTWVNDFTVTINSEGERLNTTGFDLDPNEIDAKKAMGLSNHINVTFLKSDGNLEVIRKNNQSTQLTESDDLQWIRDVKVNPWDGIEFKVSANKDLKTTYKILDWGDPKGVRVVWRDNDDYRNKWRHTHYTREEVENYVNKGNWIIVNKNITEGEDELQWIRDVEPEDPYNPYIGMKWVVEDEKTLSLDPIVYEIIDMTQEGMTLKWVGNMGEVKSAPFSLENYVKLVRDRRVKIVNNIVKESDDLQWIRDIEPNPRKPEKGFIYKFYNYSNSIDGEHIKTDDIIITHVTGDHVYFDTVNRYWANHPMDPGSDGIDKKGFSRLINTGDIKYIGPESINESDDLQWIRDINTQLPKNIDWWLINDVDPYSLEVSEEIQDFLFDQGFTWISGRRKFLPERFYAVSHRGGTHSENSGKFSYYPPRIPKKIEQDIKAIKATAMETLGEVYYWSQLKSDSLNESNDLDWIKDINPIPELKVGSCFTDVMDSTQRKWVIVDFKMTPAGTRLVVVKNNDKTFVDDLSPFNSDDIKYIHKEYFEQDLFSGRYKPCQR